MSTVKHIIDLEIQARKAGITIETICERARIRSSTWRRWRSGENSPTIKKLDGVHRAIRDLINEGQVAKQPEQRGAT